MSTVLDHLAAVPMFAACTEKELRLVERRSERLSVAQGDALTVEGRRGQEFYVLIDGKAEVLRGDKVVAVLGAGSWFGEVALLDPAPRSATVRMAEAGEVLELTRSNFFTLLEEVPGLAVRLLTGLARRLHELEAPPA